MQNRLNNLEKIGLSGVSGCKTYRKPRIKAPVTIIIAIKCMQGIVIACDSRTIDPSGYVNDDAHKLHLIEFEDGNAAIIGEAGNAEFSSRAIEMIELAAKQKQVSDYRSVATCAESAVSELKQKIREQYKGTAEELQKHFENYSFELMIAHYWNNEPYVFTLSFATGIATKKDRDFCAIGCGWILAEFLISRIDVSLFGTAYGMWTAAYAIEEIKKFDSRCGGRTRAAIVKVGQGISRATVIHDEGMQEAIDEAAAFSNESKSEWSETAHKRIGKILERKKGQQS